VQLKLTSGGTTYVGAAYRNGQQPDWLHVTIAGERPNYEVVLYINDTSKPLGRYSAVLSVGTADDEGHILEYRDIDVSYEIVAGLAILDTSVIATTVAGTGAPIQNQGVRVRGSGLSYQASSSASWLLVPTGTRTADEDLPLSFDATGLAPGSYTATLTVTNTADATDTASVAVTRVVNSP